MVSFSSNSSSYPNILPFISVIFFFWIMKLAELNSLSVVPSKLNLGTERVVPGFNLFCGVPEMCGVISRLRDRGVVSELWLGSPSHIVYYFLSL